MYRIVIDPGHGGSDPGAVGFGRKESDDVMRLAELVTEDAQTQGLNIFLTRSKGQTAAPGVSTRAAIANEVDAALFISLHRNAFTTATAKGVEVWVQAAPRADEERVARRILDNIAAVGITQNRGVKRCDPNNNFAVLRLTAMPAVMVELGFITNEEDNRMFDQHIAEYAKAIVDGILAALGLERKAAPPTDDETAELKAEIARLEQEVATRQQQTQELTERIARLSAELDNKDAEIATREQQTRELTAKAEALKAKAAQVQMLASEMLRV